MNPSFLISFFSINSNTFFTTLPNISGLVHGFHWRTYSLSVFKKEQDHGTESITDTEMIFSFSVTVTCQRLILLSHDLGFKKASRK